jgi:hypothetical protein
MSKKDFEKEIKEHLENKDINIEKKYFTEEDAKRDMETNPNAIYLDNKNMNPADIHDLDNFVKQLVSLLEFIYTDEMVLLEETDNTKFIRDLETKFEDFVNKYYSIFKMLTSDKTTREDNIAKLLGLVELLKEVQTGKSDMNNSFEKYKETLAEDYIYPQYGGKAKFEEQMMKDKKQDKKKNKSKYK